MGKACIVVALAAAGLAVPGAARADSAIVCSPSRDHAFGWIESAGRGATALQGERSRNEETIDYLHTLRDEACACKDARCRQTVTGYFVAFSAEHQNDRFTDEERRANLQVATELDACLEAQ